MHVCIPFIYYFIIFFSSYEYTFIYKSRSMAKEANFDCNRLKINQKCSKYSFECKRFIQFQIEIKNTLYSV